MQEKNTTDIEYQRLLNHYDVLARKIPLERLSRYAPYDPREARHQSFVSIERKRKFLSTKPIEHAVHSHEYNAKPYTPDIRPASSNRHNYELISNPRETPFFSLHGPGYDTMAQYFDPRLTYRRDVLGETVFNQQAFIEPSEEIPATNDLIFENLPDTYSYNSIDKLELQDISKIVEAQSKEISSSSSPNTPDKKTTLLPEKKTTLLPEKKSPVSLDKSIDEMEYRDSLLEQTASKKPAAAEPLTTRTASLLKMAITKHTATVATANAAAAATAAATAAAATAAVETPENSFLEEISSSNLSSSTPVRKGKQTRKSKRLSRLPTDPDDSFLEEIGRDSQPPEDEDVPVIGNWKTHPNKKGSKKRGLRLVVPDSLIGRVYGNDGQRLKAIQAIASTRIDINKLPPSDHLIVLEGPPHSKALCKAQELINTALQNGDIDSCIKASRWYKDRAALIQQWNEKVGDWRKQGDIYQLVIPNSLVGHVTGKKNKRIKAITYISRAKVKIRPSENLNLRERTITVSGTETAVSKAKEIIAAALQTDNIERFTAAPSTPSSTTTSPTTPAPRTPEVEVSSPLVEVSSPLVEVSSPLVEVSSPLVDVETGGDMPVQENLISSSVERTSSADTSIESRTSPNSRPSPNNRTSETYRSPDNTNQYLIENIIENNQYYIEKTQPKHSTRKDSPSRNSLLNASLSSIRNLKGECLPKSQKRSLHKEHSKSPPKTDTTDAKFKALPLKDREIAKQLQYFCTCWVEDTKHESCVDPYSEFLFLIDNRYTVSVPMCTTNAALGVLIRNAGVGSERFILRTALFTSELLKLLNSQ